MHLTKFYAVHSWDDAQLLQVRLEILTLTYLAAEGQGANAASAVASPHLATVWQGQVV